MSRFRLLAVPLLAAALAGCGGSTGDDFLLARSGQGPGARLTLVVADDGTVSCDRGKSRELPSARLLDARALTREVSDDARKHKRYPVRRGLDPALSDQDAGRHGDVGGHEPSAARALPPAGVLRPPGLHGRLRVFPLGDVPPG